jgi:glycogen phosphorylase
MTRTKAVAKSHDRGESALHVGYSSYDRHLVFDHVVSLANASQRERFEAVARFLRDLLTERWLVTQETYDKENPKRVYYLSMEFLIGRTLVNNIINLGAEKFVNDNLQSDPRQVLAARPRRRRFVPFSVDDPRSSELSATAKSSVCDG